MRKKWRTVLFLLGALGMLAGCGKGNLKIADLKDTEVEKYVTLPDYRNLDVAKPAKMEITDGYVKEYLDNRVNAVDAMHEFAGTVEDGDVVNIDYAGTIDGTAFQGGTAQGQLLEIGSGSFIDGFEAGLIGAKVGDTKELDLKFPDNYGNAELAGKDCVFAVKINYILAKLTDENVKLLDEGYESADAYIEGAKTALEQYARYQYEAQLENALATSLIAACTFKEIPNSLVDDFRTSLRTEFERMAGKAGVTYEEYMTTTYQLSADKLKEEMDSLALRCAKEGLALQAIADAEGILVSEEEIDEAVAQYTEAGNAAEDLDREMLRVNLLDGKVYSLLMDLYKD